MIGEKMGDVSQSRYSIVERLTERKLEIIGAIDGVDEEIIEAEQKVKQLKTDFSNWDGLREAENNKIEKEKKAEIDRAQLKVEHLKSLQRTAKGTYEKQLKAIDSALEQIEEISKSSAQEASK
jgi:seryl-tRNA synthetase